LACRRRDRGVEGRVGDRLPHVDLAPGGRSLGTLAAGDLLDRGAVADVGLDQRRPVCQRLLDVLARPVERSSTMNGLVAARQQRVRSDSNR